MSTKQIASPFSTGGGGTNFENRVQASFVALMGTGGYAPCLPCWPIKKIKMQGRYEGFETDDLIVFAERSPGGEVRKLLGQIKHSMEISKNKKFTGVAQAMWNDFNNAKLFTKGKDVLALITGPLVKDDIEHMRPVLEWARAAENADDFFEKIELTKTTRLGDEKKAKKVEVFRSCLISANDGNAIAENDLYEFLCHFHFLGYDLDIKSGVTLSLLHSAIGRASSGEANSLWAQIFEAVGHASSSAGTITPKSLPEEVLKALRRPEEKLEFASRQLAPDEDSGRKERDVSAEIQAGKAIGADANHFKHATNLAIATLIGSWDEKNEADTEFVSRVAGEEYASWILKVREERRENPRFLSINSGVWRVKDRKALWQAVGPELYNDMLNRFQVASINLLKERDLKFDLPSEERYMANIHGKILRYSGAIRRGIAEGLALLGSRPKALRSAPQHEAEFIPGGVLREVFKEADWMGWGSLDRLLPTLAEAAPDEFIKVVEQALQETPSPFIELLLQERKGAWGGMYFAGLLWALEALAWDEKYMGRVCLMLAKLATLDPRGKWANHPLDSLTTILLPWFPQTLAPVNQRVTAVRRLQREYPEVAWKLLVSLLPNQKHSSSGTHKPAWRGIIPDGWEKKKVLQRDYWKQVESYSQCLIEMAREDLGKLKELADLLDDLPRESFEEALVALSSGFVVGQSEENRFAVWDALEEFTKRHRKYSEQEWALDGEAVSRIESVAKKIAPKDPQCVYRILFSGRVDLYGEGTYSEREEELNNERKEAIEEILEVSGVEGVKAFAEKVSLPSDVGHAFGSIADSSFDEALIPELLLKKKRWQREFIGGYVWSRRYNEGWAWADELEKLTWSEEHVVQFLEYLPFTQEAWNRVRDWLGDSERAYWKATRAASHQARCDLGEAIEKLLKYGRPKAAIDCLHRMYSGRNVLDTAKASRALLEAVESEESVGQMEEYSLVGLIKALQKDPGTNPGDLLQVEWAYLPLLDGRRDALPTVLESRLVSDPTFFCQNIQGLYRAKKKVSEDEKEPSESERVRAEKASRLLYQWKTPPGMLGEGEFSENVFRNWFDEVTKICGESGHLEMALLHIGKVFIHCPPDPAGLWIHKEAAHVLDAEDAEVLREGFENAMLNSRGVYKVDPTGVPECDLAKQYRGKASALREEGLFIFAATMESLAETYERLAERISSGNLIPPGY